MREVWVRSRANALAGTLAAAWLAGGCAGADARGSSDEGPAVERLDSAGVEIVSWSLQHLEGLPVLTSDSTPLLVVGQVDGPPGVTLNQVRAVTTRPGGGLVIADDNGTVIRWYGPDGTYLGQQGREGEGPGEYRRIDGLTWLPGDSLAVLEKREGRVTVLDPDFAFVRTLRIEGMGGLATMGGGTTDLQGMGSYSSVALSQRFSAFDRLRQAAPGDLGTRLEQDTLALVLVRPEGDHLLADTLMSFPGGSFAVEQTESRLRRSGLRFGSYPHLSGNATGFALAHGSKGEVRLYDPDGTLRRIVRIQGDARPVSDADRAPIDSVFQESLRNPPPDRPVSAAPRPPAFAERHALITALHLDETGNVWVRLDQGLVGGRGWLVVGPDGDLRAFQTHLGPSGLVRYVGTDHVLAVATDELGVQRVYKYPVGWN